MMAFAEAFTPLAGWFERVLGEFDPRIISLPATLGLIALVLTKGADLGVRALLGVATVLGVSLTMFFLGSAPAELRPEVVPMLSNLASPDAFMLVFAIVFPAFTGMTAGVGLSGDLANPRKSIPLGIIAATFAGMIVYILVVLKLGTSVRATELASDQLIMARIAL